MNDLNLRNQLRHKRIQLSCLAVSCVLANFLFALPVIGQAPTPGPVAQSGSSSYSNGAGNGASGQSSNPGAALGQSPFSGSVPEGKATTEVLQLSFKDAIDRGLRN